AVRPDTATPDCSDQGAGLYPSNIPGEPQSGRYGTAHQRSDLEGNLVWDSYEAVGADDGFLRERPGAEALGQGLIVTKLPWTPIQASRTEHRMSLFAAGAVAAVVRQ